MKLFTSIDKSEGRCTASEVGKPWELRWGIEDMEQGICELMDVGSPRKIINDEPEPQGPHRLLAGLDPDHPDTDRAILRRLYHQDPEKFLDNYGTAGINKLMDIAVKEERPDVLPAVDNLAAWTKMTKDAARMVSKAGVKSAHSAAILLALLHEAGHDLRKLGELLHVQD